MNDVFNIKRFGLLFKEQTSKNLKLFLMGTVLVFAVLFALMLISIIALNNQHLNFDIRLGYYAFFLFPSALLLSSIWFSYLSKKSPEIGNLLLPVSAFERILVAFIINVIIFSLLYLLIVLSIELILFQDFTILHYVFHFFKYYTFYAVLFFLQSIFLIGSLIFKKASTIKTGFSLFIIIIILQLISTITLRLTFKVLTSDFGDMFFTNNYQLIKPSYSGTIENILIYMGFPLIWVASYFKLKEKQV